MGGDRVDLWGFILDQVLLTATVFKLGTLPTFKALGMAYRIKCSRGVQR